MRALDRGLGAGNRPAGRRHCRWRSGRPRPCAASRRPLRHRPCSSADDRRHGALADRHGRLHGVAANAQQPRRVGDRERAGGRERRIFAERMAGDDRRPCRDDRGRFGFQHADRREPHRHQRRLGVGGQRQLSSGPSHIRLGQASRRARRRLPANTARASAKVSAELLAHADGLAALSGKDESQRHARRLSDRPSSVGPSDRALRLS